MLFVGCTALSGGRFQHNYKVILSGGAYWYYQSQLAPNATINIGVASTVKIVTLSSVSISIGASASSGTGRSAAIALSPYASAC